MEIQDLREMVDLEPDDPLMRYVLATKLLEEAPDGALDEAIGHLGRVIELDSRHVASYLALGQAYLRAGREESARDVLERGRDVAATLTHGEGLDLVPEFEALLESL